MKSFIVTLLISCTIVLQGNAQERSNHGNKFEQLDQTFATPNTYRNADGAPGPDYWQQQVDYKIKCSLDVEAQRLDGSEVPLEQGRRQGPQALRRPRGPLLDRQEEPPKDPLSELVHAEAQVRRLSSKPAPFPTSPALGDVVMPARGLSPSLHRSV